MKIRQFQMYEQPLQFVYVNAGMLAKKSVRIAEDGATGQPDYIRRSSSASGLMPGSYQNCTLHCALLTQPSLKLTSIFLTNHKPPNAIKISS